MQEVMFKINDLTGTRNNHTNDDQTCAKFPCDICKYEGKSLDDLKKQN